MKSTILIFILLFAFTFSFNAQEKKKESSKDTVKTEVVEVVTTYNPKIIDASKIKNNPTIKILEKSKKKKLEYAIFSVPVASTFIPRSGVVKGIDVGVKERIYKNYIAAGFGNYNTPFTELYLHHSTRFENEIGLHIKYLAAQENIGSTVLNSTFSNFKLGAFYKQEDRYYTWKVGFDTELNDYNWYGLPNINFTQPTTNFINPLQSYKYVKTFGEFKFVDSYIDFAKLNFSYFTDNYSSGEVKANFDTKLNFPLDFLKSGLNDISINAGVEYLFGYFENNYERNNAIKYSILTTKINPEYRLKYLGFSLKTGLKIITSLDSENNTTNFFIFPDVHLKRRIIKNYLNIYGGLTGGLHTNTYKEFTENNPFVSPTLFITQTATTSNYFLGFNGKITQDISFNILTSIKNEEDKPLFIKNNSKSDGTFNLINGTPLLNYEYGNSFGIFYDDVKTTSIFAEIEYDFTKNLVFGTYFKYNSYSLIKALEAFNLPEIEANLFAKYKKNKWYATSNIFYVGDRKDIVYNGAYSSSINSIQTINSFIDVNINGGYHFNDKFSVFIKLNNILNSNYQRFADFDVQGFQILGGITWKFDF